MIKDYLKNNLTVDIDMNTTHGFYSTKYNIKVTIMLEGEEITTDSTRLNLKV